jgi:DNA polymerase epsilon subunit 1
MPWLWRGDFSPATFSEYQRVKTQLTYERVGNPPKPFNELSEKEQSGEVQRRLKQYTHRVYKKTKVSSTHELRQLYLRYFVRSYLVAYCFALLSCF